ncbi:UDP-galactose translocator [Schistocerca piceifrons]|uniref:UDP-galactose translocator n=1 Tax=Schistocerca piceifrons TaxID=274613 RepID=UPI001F5E58B8|nr:UDP-galactose translocator [Schistocerca piceifrons]XP_049778117.1 UDP-galactose translocator [Schistocerca cancellata]XP_049860141.1 UDP-galactose translocator [Schistocerca gregaria]XP_049958604.1 UDP-galactose translocator [Schistocerca serialis cubense]
MSSVSNLKVASNIQQRRVLILKHLSLITLTLQNAILGLSMRYARTRVGDMFFSSTAVFMSEVVKLFTCILLVWQEEGSLQRCVTALHNTIIKQPMDTLKVCVPSLVYIIQNNMLYVSASHLDAATYQVTYQLKILTTAMFTVLILRRSLRPLQWVALVVLLIGVVLVQLAHTDPPTPPPAGAPKQNRFIGFSAALFACVLSGFAGIYFEKILKGSDISVWMRNVQLSFLSLPFGLLTCLFNDWTKIKHVGFFFGYDFFVWYLVVLQAGGGLLVAMVVKYADNILKGFATSLAIVISCIASIYLFNFQLELQFVVGALLVMCSIFMYSYQPKAPQPQSGITIKV